MFAGNIVAEITPMGYSNGPQYIAPAVGYEASISNWQPQWLYMENIFDEFSQYMLHVNQVLHVPYHKSIEQANLSLSCAIEPYSPCFKPPLQVPQNLATQILRDENPDKFVLSTADQKAFRKLFPLRDPLLPERGADDDRPTLVLDLDETLIHTTFEVPSEPQQYERVNITLLGSTKTIYVYLRPSVALFLKKISAWYEIVIYTASLSTYADSILDTLDPNNEIFSYRLYRQHCCFFKGVYIKDLESLGRPLERTVFVDNFPGAYMMQPTNALPVRSFVGNSTDDELFECMRVLRAVKSKDDVRPHLQRYQLHWKNTHFTPGQARAISD